MISYLQVENLTKSFGDKLLFENISFGIHEKQRVALIACNGAGKTTLLNIIAGKENYENGTISFKRDLRIGILEQIPHFTPKITVSDACFASNSDVVQAIANYERLLEKHEESPAYENEFQLALAKMEQLHAWNFEVRIKQILGKLDIHNLEQPVEQLSGGQQKRLALANVLITEPDLLILDEPTNHLDLEMVEWLENFLTNSNMALLMVTHDRYFLDRVCDTLLEIDQQQLFAYKGNYSYYLDKRAARIENLTSEIEKANNLYRKELDWIRRQPQARATKAQSRIDAFYEIEQRAKQRVEEKRMAIGVKAAYLGSKIFEAQYVNKSYGDVKILDNFYYNFVRYEKLGIVGKNGTGKSTFLRLLLGEERLDSGRFDIGETVQFAYYSQSGLSFNEEMKVIDVIRDIAEEIDLGGGRKMNASQFLNHFLFTPETQHNFVHKLSGGEKRRLHLCSILIKNPNFLILDEPTNDLDIASLNVLEDYLIRFKGCVIVVSHDRFFMDKVVDHLLVFQGDAKIKDFPGNYTDYRQWREIDASTSSANNLQSACQKLPKQRTGYKSAQTEKKKLSFKEKQEFTQLETDIEHLEAEKTAIEKALSSGALTNEELLEKSERFSQIFALLDEKTERWFELCE